MDNTSSNGNKLFYSENNSNDDNYDNYDGSNCCLVCGIDMGYCNPRQLCMKTYCPEEYYSTDSETDTIDN